MLSSATWGKHVIDKEKEKHFVYFQALSSIEPCDEFTLIQTYLVCGIIHNHDYFLISPDIPEELEEKSLTKMS